jgi:hypothetical protein
MEYTIVWVTSEKGNSVLAAKVLPDELAKIVNLKLKQGWKCSGSISVIVYEERLAMYQPMVSLDF